MAVAGPHRGNLASYGIPTVKAAELVVKDINARGGVLGKKVELLVEDDDCRPEVATNTATKLLSEKIKRSGAEAVIFGGYHPEASKIVTQMRKKKMKAYFISDDG